MHHVAFAFGGGEDKASLFLFLVKVFDAQNFIGIVFAEALEKDTEPFKRGEIVGLKTICRFAFINNEDPEYLNAVIGDNNTAKIIVQTFQDYIQDGTFWESADGIIATYFDESIDNDMVKKMIQYTYTHLLD